MTIRAYIDDAGEVVMLEADTEVEREFIRSCPDDWELDDIIAAYEATVGREDAVIH